jgi:hypothetical protein
MPGYSKNATFETVSLHFQSFFLRLFAQNRRCQRHTQKCHSAVVRGGAGAGGALAPSEFGVSGKRTEREIDSLLLSAPPDFKT